MRASIAIQIEPNCQDDYEAVRIVDEVIDYIRSTGLHYYVGPSETSSRGTTCISSSIFWKTACRWPPRRAAYW